MQPGPAGSAGAPDWQAMPACERLDAVYVCLAPATAGPVAAGCAEGVATLRLTRAIDRAAASRKPQRV